MVVEEMVAADWVDFAELATVAVPAAREEAEATDPERLVVVEEATALAVEEKAAVVAPRRWEEQLTKLQGV